MPVPKGSLVFPTPWPAYYLVVDYLGHYGVREVGLSIGVFDFMELIREDRYNHLAGGFLEAIGRLFGKGVRLYVYPGLPEQGPWGLLVRTPSIGGSENAAYFAYPHQIEFTDLPVSAIGFGALRIVDASRVRQCVEPRACAFGR